VAASQPFGVPHVPDTPALDIGEDAAKPLSVEATLERKVGKEMKPARR
jgi:hypothetical protein